ncbi:MAG: hypothetical protein H6865_04525 [Rhodospirillales bacterium]|nr:hypothetical protein [Alphaproteobacteria bacterium]MCB9986883.1 hypothetical protein [Rhodospirillales bacterium]USO08339.1 MAG: hypothetical protein H6866_03765 [Rhodospirillales bacterium]
MSDSVAAVDAGAPAQRPNKPSMLDRAAGDTARVPATLTPVLPHELVAGSVPAVIGLEESAVWNAAVQACGTERVHYVFTVESGRCWYLAVPSAALASDPDSWCPLAAALPGNSEYWDKETVYLYEHEGQAGALRWDPETGRMQLFLGPSRTILPRVQSLDANFVTINPLMAQLVPWRNKDLRTDQLSRAAGRILLYSGLSVTLIALALMIVTYLAAALLQPQLENARSKVDTATNNLMTNASTALESDVFKHFNRIQELLDALYGLKGTLVRYEVKQDGSVEWEALVPPAYTAGSSEALRGSAPVGGVEKDGRVRIRGTQ